MSRRIEDDPTRLKWCSGNCGRQLPVTEFYKASGGWPQAECKACHRVVSNDNRRKRYATNVAKRRKERARVHAYYLAHAEERKAYSRAWHQARKARLGHQVEGRAVQSLPTAGPTFLAKIKAAIGPERRGRPRKNVGQTRELEVHGGELALPAIERARASSPGVWSKGRRKNAA